MTRELNLCLPPALDCMPHKNVLHGIHALGAFFGHLDASVTRSRYLTTHLTTLHNNTRIQIPATGQLIPVQIPAPNIATGPPHVTYHVQSKSMGSGDTGAAGFPS